MASPTLEEFRRAMAQLPTGVTIVSASGRRGPAGATANAVASLSLRPALMLASLDRGSRTLAAIEAAGAFGVNVLRAGHAELARSFASKAPHTEKWREIAWSERGGVPVIDDALAWVACELRDRHDGGDHVMLTGEVVELGVAEDGDPLVFHAGTYRGLGPS
jgi:flavin reductase (DIM6/NTAB) family NADH-FMN oxidoreductase RutF